MQSLIDKVKEDERKMRKADLRLLQEQIQPHFLYNTLDTIVWLIESNEPDEAVTMVVTLSDFFREILSKGKEFISIKEEEKHISSYLQIQEMRYRDILEYDIQLDQVIYKYQILKLTLQPVVDTLIYICQTKPLLRLLAGLLNLLTKLFKLFLIPARRRRRGLVLQM